MGVLEVGQELDRYVVEELLGEGGLAAVYRVRHSGLGTTHALKVLKRAGTWIRSRMIREGQLQGGLHHPNVVAITDLIVIEGAPGLIMELVDGPALDKWLKTHSPSLEDSEAIFRGVVAGVMAAHSRGLVHRDLKTANILLETIDGRLIPKVSDFGLAKLVIPDDETLNPSLSTQTGMPMGTPCFMSPEQIRSAKHVDERSDIFSLGCVLYRLVCGKLPFRGRDVLQIFNRVAQGRYEDPHELKPDLPQRFVRTIEGCLRVDPEHRIPNCQALLEVLSTRLEKDVPEPEMEDYATFSLLPGAASLPSSLLDAPSFHPPPPKGIDEDEAEVSTVGMGDLTPTEVAARKARLVMEMEFGEPAPPLPSDPTDAPTKDVFGDSDPPPISTALDPILHDEPPQEDIEDYPDVSLEAVTTGDPETVAVTTNASRENNDSPESWKGWQLGLGALTTVAGVTGIFTFVILTGIGIWWLSRPPTEQTVQTPVEVVADDDYTWVGPRLPSDFGETEGIDGPTENPDANPDTTPNPEIEPPVEPEPAKPAPSSSACSGAPGELIGWVSLKGSVIRPKTTWTPKRTVKVHSKIGSRSVVCVLRSGQTVRILRGPSKVKKLGWWAGVGGPT